MRAALLVLLAGLAAGVRATSCSQGNYVCVGSREFCLGGYIFECPEGTDCTGMVNGQSPCTWGTSKPRCPGDFDDWSCCDSKHYCVQGQKHACDGGKRCRGSGNASSIPCHSGDSGCHGDHCDGGGNVLVVKEVVVIVYVNGKRCDADCPQPCTDNQSTDCVPLCDDNDKVDCYRPCDGDSCCDSEDKTNCVHPSPSPPPPPPPPPTCPKGDWVCTSNTTYCEGGEDITCPRNSFCYGSAPCVHRTRCHEPDSKPPTCTEGNLTCIDDKAYCSSGLAYECPEGTKCTGSTIDGRSPCWRDAVYTCPGPFADFQCLDKGSYCLGGSAVKCPENTFCSADGGEDSPCVPTEPTTPACTQPNKGCVNFGEYCADGVGYACPEDTVCRGFAPCVSQPDLTCNAVDYTCLDKRDWCFQGETLRCPEGYSCKGPRADGNSNPCQEDLPPAPCPGPFEDYQCMDLNVYCLDGVTQWCPDKTYCVGNVTNDEEICQATKPAPTCSQPNFICQDEGTYCYGGAPFKCPSDMLCKGAPPYPCVEQGWCSDNSTHPDPQCDTHDFSCVNDNEFCHGGEVLRCPSGTSCKDQEDGGHCCVEHKPKDRCPGSWDDYHCCDKHHFCVGGFQHKCPNGQLCLADGQANPCKVPDADHNSLCPIGDCACTGERSYCDGGREFTCPGGAVCRGWAPCVYHKGDGGHGAYS